MKNKHILLVFVSVFAFFFALGRFLPVYGQGTGHCSSSYLAKLEANGNHEGPEGNHTYLWWGSFIYNGHIAVSSVYVKAGTSCYQYTSDTNNGCYNVSGLGTTYVSVSKSCCGGPSCKNISHIEFVGSSVTPTPTCTATPTPTCTATPTPTVEPTPTDEPTPTPTQGEGEPTPTPTTEVVPTATPTQTSSDNGGVGGNGGGSVSAPVCNATKPSTPTLLSVEAIGSGKVRLTWSSASPVTTYAISYGLYGKDFEYGVASTGNVTSFEVSGLTVGQRYSFVVRGVNDCMPGDPSNTLSTGGSVLGASTGQVLGASTMAGTGVVNQTIAMILSAFGSVSVLASRLVKKIK